MPNWTYLGYVCTSVGFAFAFTGAIALYLLQFGDLQKTQYSPSFLPIFITGIAASSMGWLFLAYSHLKQKREVPPPPPADPPPPPP